MRSLLLVLSLTGCAETAVQHCARSAARGVDECFATPAERDAYIAADRDQRARRIAAESHVRMAERARLEKEQSDAEARQREEAEAAYRERVEAEREARRVKDEREATARQRAMAPAWAVPALSALICESQSNLTELGAETQQQGRIEANGGVKDLRARREIAESVEEQRSAISRRRAVLRDRFGARPSACSGAFGGGRPLLQAPRGVPDFAGPRRRAAVR
jgi:hypothetical protein